MPATATSTGEWDWPLTNLGRLRIAGMNSGGVEGPEGPSPAVPGPPRFTTVEPSQLTWKRVLALAVTQLSALPVVDLITKTQTPSPVVVLGSVVLLVVALIGIVLVS